jgi:predicted kinase
MASQTLPGELHFFCGKAGAGKSTRAAQLARELGAVLLSEDVLMLQLYPEELASFDDYRRLVPRLRAAIGPLVTQVLSAGQPVVLDFPANTAASRAWFRTLFEAARAPHVLHFVDVPDATCLAQIARRNEERPEGSHHLTPEQFAQISSYFEPPGAQEGFTVRRLAPA